MIEAPAIANAEFLKAERRQTLGGIRRSMWLEQREQGARA